MNILPQKSFLICKPKKLIQKYPKKSTHLNHWELIQNLPKILSNLKNSTKTRHKHFFLDYSNPELRSNHKKTWKSNNLTERETKVRLELIPNEYWLPAKANNSGRCKVSWTALPQHARKGSAWKSVATRRPLIRNKGRTWEEKETEEENVVFSFVWGRFERVWRIGMSFWEFLWMNN